MKFILLEISGCLLSGIGMLIIQCMNNLWFSAIGLFVIYIGYTLIKLPEDIRTREYINELKLENYRLRKMK